MSIIIRPSDSVFKRTTPLVLIFGAYRRFDLDPPLSQEELDTITQVVALSRRLRAPLAFSRLVPEDRAPEAGVWLPDCRPPRCMCATRIPVRGCRRCAPRGWR